MNAKANDIAWTVTLAGCWVWTCNQLSLDWSAYPNYGFGYYVPWIAFLLAWRRIGAKPGCLRPAPPARHSAHFFIGVALLLAWGLFLFGELVHGFDPHWRIVCWAMMASTTLLTGVWLWRRGGGLLFKHLAFPLGFAWTAVPWPTNVEEAVTRNLQAFVTSTAVSTLRLTGIEASHQGNVINLASGSVIVDSACSGISSFQVSLMASLFLGEFFRLGAARRIFLLAAGAGLAVAANLVRATTLVWLANQGGPARLLEYHDRLGYAETCGIFLALLAVACLLAWQSGGRATESKGSLPGAGEAASSPRRIPSTGIWAGIEGFAALAAFASIPFIAWAWFALSPGGPIREQDAPLWTLKESSATRDWRVLPVTLSQSDVRSLDYTEAQTISLEGAASVDVYHFFWKTDSSTGFGHTPDNCMEGAGWQKKGEPVTAMLQIKDVEFPCKVYRFTRAGEETVVFQSIWYGGDPMLSRNELPDTKDAPRASRLALLWTEPRRRGLESLNVYMPPAGGPAAEIRMAEAVLAQVLVPNR